MSEQIGMQHVQAELPEILRRVAAGESFTITQRGKPVADLLPSQHRPALAERDPEAIKAAIARMRSIRKTVAPVSDERLKQMIGRGRT